jgi:hypothetical protein
MRTNGGSAFSHWQLDIQDTNWHTYEIDMTQGYTGDVPVLSAVRMFELEYALGAPYQVGACTVKIDSVEVGVLQQATPTPTPIPTATPTATPYNPNPTPSPTPTQIIEPTPTLTSEPLPEEKPFSANLLLQFSGVICIASGLVLMRKKKEQ